MLLNRLKKSNLVKSGGINLIGKVGTAFIGLFANLYIARTYGSDIVGKLALIQSLLSISNVFCILGTNTSVLRFIPEHYMKYSFRSSQRIFKRLRNIVMVTSAIVMLILVVFGKWFNTTIFKDFDHPLLYYTSIVLIIFYSLHNLNLESLRALKSVKRYSIIPLISSFLNLALLISFSKFINDDYYPIYLFFMVTLLNFTVSGIFSGKLFHNKISNDQRTAMRTYPGKYLLKVSVPMFLTAAMHIMISQTDILMLGYFSTDDAVGIYAICNKISLLISFVLVAINSVVAPQFSEFYFSGKIPALNSLAQRASRLTFIITLPAVLAVGLGGKYILSLFGTEFTSGYYVLIVLAAGQLINAFSGSVGLYLNMTGKQNVFQRIVLIAAALNIILNLLLIPSFGLMGAAVASMIAISFQNIASALYINIKLKVNITAFRFSR